MKTLLPKILLSLGICAALSPAEECPVAILPSAVVVSAEGRFVNRENIEVHVDLMWQHLPGIADTFDVTLSGNRSFRYVSAPDFRYMEYLPGRIPRQMAMHHLKENIGESPLKWDDFELLSQGDFLCRDSAHSDTSTLYTAKSQAWLHLKPSSPIQPDSLSMFGPRQETRSLYIHSWGDYGGIRLPTIIDIRGANDSGSLWIRTARQILPKAGTPATFEKAGKPPLSPSPLWNGPDGESKIPLVLQMQ